MKITKKERMDAIQAIVNLSEGAEWFTEKKGCKFVEVYDERIPFEYKNMEGAFGFKKDDPETIHIDIRGSNDPQDWKYNFKFFSKRLDIKGDPYEFVIPYDSMKGKSPICAHRGFILCYKESGLREKILEKVSKGGFKKVSIKGHSLGSAMAILGAVDLQKNELVESKNIVCYPFSSPRVFNESGVESFNRRVPNTMLYWYRNDVVVKNLFQVAAGQRHIDHWQSYNVGKMKAWEWILPWNFLWMGWFGYSGDHYPQKLQKQMDMEIEAD